MANKKRVERQKARAVRKSNRQEDLAKIKAADALGSEPSSPIASKRADKKAQKAKVRRWREGAKEMEKELSAVKAESSSPSMSSPIDAPVDTPAEKVAPTLLKTLSDVKENGEVEVKNIVPKINGGDPAAETIDLGVKNAKTFTEAKEAVDNASILKQEIKNIGEKIDEEDDLIRKGGDGSALKEQADNGDGKYDFTSDEDFRKASLEYREELAAAKASAPAAAIEKLGFQDYYPPQEDYLRANFTGRGIGSREIVVAAGALYPEGLVDARNRANEAKAVAKETAEKDFWELTSTAPQYDELYKDKGMDILTKYADAAGGDLSGLLTGNSKLSQQFRRDMLDFEARGKNIIEVNGYVDELVKILSDGKGARFLPKKTLKTLYSIRSGTADMGDYLDGKTIGDEKMKGFTNELRSFANFTKLANEELTLLKTLGANKLPFAAGSDFSDPTFAANARAAIDVAKHSVDYETFYEATSEFWNVGEIETIVENMYSNNDLYTGKSEKEKEKIIQDGVMYMMANLPEVIDIETKIQTNKNLGWSQLGQRKYEYESESEFRERQYESMWDGINKDLQEPGLTGDINSAIEAYSPGAARKNAIADIFSKQDKSVEQIGGIIVAKIPTQGIENTTKQARELSVISDDGKSMLTLDASISKKRKRRVEIDAFILANPTSSKTANLKKEKKKLYNDIKTIQTIKSSGTVQHNVGSRASGFSNYDSRTKSYVPSQDYTGASTKEDLIRTGYEVGKVGLVVGRDATSGKDIIKATEMVFVSSVNIGAKEARRSLTKEEKSEDRSKLFPVNGQGASGSSSSSGSGGGN